MECPASVIWSLAWNVGTIVVRSTGHNQTFELRVHDLSPKFTIWVDKLHFQIVWASCYARDRLLVRHVDKVSALIGMKIHEPMALARRAPRDARDVAKISVPSKFSNAHQHGSQRSWTWIMAFMNMDQNIHEHGACRFGEPHVTPEMSPRYLCLEEMPHSPNALSPACVHEHQTKQLTETICTTSENDSSTAGDCI